MDVKNITVGAAVGTGGSFGEEKNIKNEGYETSNNKSQAKKLERIIPTIPNVPYYLVKRFFDEYPLLLFFVYDRYHDKIKNYVNENIEKIDQRSGESCLFWFPYLDNKDYYLENILNPKEKESIEQVRTYEPQNEISFLKETFGLRQNEIPCIVVSEPGDSGAFIIKIDCSEYSFDQFFDLIISCAEKAKIADKRKRKFNRTFKHEMRIAKIRHVYTRSSIPIISIILQILGIAIR